MFYLLPYYTGTCFSKEGHPALEDLLTQTLATLSPDFKNQMFLPWYAGLKHVFLVLVPLPSTISSLAQGQGHLLLPPPMDSCLRGETLAPEVYPLYQGTCM